MKAIFSFDLAGLSEDQADGLTGEVLAQAEASERHPDVGVVQLDREQLVGLIRSALKRASERDLQDDEFLDIIEEELVHALAGEPRAPLVGNVLSEGVDFFTALEERGYSVQEGQQRTPTGNGDDLFFNPYLAAYVLERADFERIGVPRERFDLAELTELYVRFFKRNPVRSLDDPRRAS